MQPTLLQFLIDQPGLVRPSERLPRGARTMSANSVGDMVTPTPQSHRDLFCQHRSETRRKLPD